MEVSAFSNASCFSFKSDSFDEIFTVTNTSTALTRDQGQGHTDVDQTSSSQLLPSATSGRRQGQGHNMEVAEGQGHGEIIYGPSDIPISYNEVCR